MGFKRSKDKSGSLIMSQSGVTMEVNEENMTDVTEDESVYNNNSITDSTANLIVVPLSGTGKTFRNIFVVILLFLINLVNYCDRYTLAS